MMFTGEGEEEYGFLGSRQEVESSKSLAKPLHGPNRGPNNVEVILLLKITTKGPFLGARKPQPHEILPFS